jgi:hypothetical protein
MNAARLHTTGAISAPPRIRRRFWLRYGALVPIAAGLGMWAGSVLRAMLW